MNKLIVNAETYKLTMGFVSNEETRFYLRGAAIQKHVDGAVMVATNGHYMGAFRLYLSDVLFAWEGAGPIVELPPDGLKACTPAKRSICSKNWLIVEHGEQFGQAKAMIVNAETIEGVEEARIEPALIVWQGFAHIIDGSFPDWRRVLPKPESSKKPVFACYDGRLLAPFVAVALSANTIKTKESKCPLSFGAEDDSSPIVVWTMRDDFLGVLMGMRGGRAFEFPQWATCNADMPEPKGKSKAA